VGVLNTYNANFRVRYFASVGRKIAASCLQTFLTTTPPIKELKN